jgi:hypothetical protein
MQKKVDTQSGAKITWHCKFNMFPPVSSDFYATLHAHIKNEVRTRDPSVAPIPDRGHTRPLDYSGYT